GATVEAGDLPPVPNAGNFEIESSGIINLVGTGSVTLHFDFIPPLTASQWFVYLWEGQWTAVAGPLPSYDVVVDLGSKAPGDFGWAYGSGSDPSLPVELSAFNAIFTAQKFVKLTWISESETGLLGYRIYRGESNVQNNATSITPNMIDATNTSSTHVYTHEDHEVINNTGYYYWLEAVDLTHSTFYGPQYVEVIHEEVPELPLQTVMKSAYPNPFSANSVTNIHVDIKAGDSGTVTIYNVLGQAVKTFQVKEGFNPLTWNGRDSRNNACGSGIYFYRLSTPSKIETKKMVIVK
ncbi:MAG: T9SS type A sorting domain-containing protein, partial [Candidatus Cloacimonadaceae bacterium]